MQADPDRRPHPVRKRLLGPSGHLEAALEELAQGHGRIMRHAVKAWASVTFEGARHMVEIAFDGGEAVAAGEAFIGALPEHEFAIPGQLVADADVTQVEHILLPRPRLTVECELLLLKDA